MSPLRSRRELIGLRRQGGGQSVDGRTRETRRIDDDPHLGIDVGRARVEIERPDEELPAVDRERLGVQAGRRVAQTSALSILPDGILADLPEFDAGLEGAPSASAHSPHARARRPVDLSEFVTTTTCTPGVAGGSTNHSTPLSRGRSRATPLQPRSAPSRRSASTARSPRSKWRSNPASAFSGGS